MDYEIVERLVRNGEESITICYADGTVIRWDGNSSGDSGSPVVIGYLVERGDK
jgi:hypothetical protein